MDFIDHLIYTTNTEKARSQFSFILSDNINPKGIQGLPGSNENPIVNPVPLPVVTTNGKYPIDIREKFVFYQDPAVIDRAIQKHWFDMTNGPITIIDSSNPANNQKIFDLSDTPIYHLIYAYLIENSRIVQIMERLIYLYQHDEVLGVASSGNPIHQLAFQWILNTENLYFKTLPNTSSRNISGNLRPNPESSRRNAYYRLFGMDLAFGESTGQVNTDYPYYKPKTANKEFIVLFEQFLTEIWQAYINAKNSAGANTTDYQRITDMAIKIREMLMARRGAAGTISLQNYRFMNLSKEEYSSVGFLSWLFFIISYDSPLVIFLGCQSNTASERLSNIGKKVGLEAHKKSQALFDMAAPMATVLRAIEFGTMEGPGSSKDWIQESIESQVNPATLEQKAALIDLLTIINNWEKATGHKIKNQEANISGTIKVQQNGAPRTLALN